MTPKEAKEIVDIEKRYFQIWKDNNAWGDAWVVTLEASNFGTKEEAEQFIEAIKKLTT